MTETSNEKWFVVKTNPRAEKKVFERILALGFNAYLPLISTMKQWSDRKKKIDIPLISSTLFVHCKESDLQKIYVVMGFHSFLHFLGKPAVVRDYEINNLKILLKETDSIELDEIEILTEGDKVEVIRGPFQGLIATSIEINRTHKLIVEIEGLGQRFTVHVPRSFVKKIRS
jgi:transcriptional antiterminator RfaH